MTRVGEERTEAGGAIVVISGNPDAEETAAITAVLTGVLEELAAEHERRDLAESSVWQRSQRALRVPVHPARGAWQSFGC